MVTSAISTTSTPRRPRCRVTVSDFASVHRARDCVAKALARWHMDDLAEIATLLTSEIVTNALLALGTTADSPSPSPVKVLLRPCGSDAVHLRVNDSILGEGSLKPKNPEDLDDSGRGLYLVDALAAAWGVAPTQLGKCVWADIALEPQ